MNFTLRELKLIEELMNVIKFSGKNLRNVEELLIDMGFAGSTEWIDENTLTRQRTFEMNWDKLNSLKEKINARNNVLRKRS